MTSRLIAFVFIVASVAVIAVGMSGLRPALAQTGAPSAQTTPAGPRAATGIVLNGGTGASLGSRMASRISSVAASWSTSAR